MISLVPNITEQVYEELKKQIVVGKIKDGERLVEDTLAAEFGVSKTPVREALARLISEKLVERIPRKGVVVRAMSYEEVVDFLEVREVLEKFAIRKAAQKVSDVDIAILKQILDESDEAAKEGDPYRYSDLDLAFHSKIIDMSDSTAIKEIIPRVYDQIRVVMRASVSLPNRFHNSVDEHRRILEALVESCPKAAEARMEEHIQVTRAAVVDFLQQSKRGE